MKLRWALQSKTMIDSKICRNTNFVTQFNFNCSNFTDNVKVGTFAKLEHELREFICLCSNWVLNWLQLGVFVPIQMSIPNVSHFCVQLASLCKSIWLCP